MLSSAYNRFMRAASSGRRRAEKPRAYVRLPAAAAEQIGVERENDVGLIEAEVRVDELAEGQAGTRSRVLTADWIPLVPARRRIAGQKLLQLPAQAWATRSIR